MTLRELMIERIFFALPEEDLQKEFFASEEELKTMSDEDFLDMYEEMFTFQG